MSHSESFGRKVSLLVLDKIFLGLIVLILLTPVQECFDARQKRHDRELQVANALVDKPLEVLGKTASDVGDFAAAIEAEQRSVPPENQKVIDARARIEGDLASLTAYQSEAEVVDASSKLLEAVRALYVPVLTQNARFTSQEIAGKLNVPMRALAAASIRAARSQVK